ncbi:MAG: beta-phosphoglucomutase [Flavobacteriales bacterium]|nr:beta-phosphoglucomutase [Flavobacteriales bacterium]
MTFKGFIFDLDGVIVDTASHHFAAWQILAEDLGVPFDEKDNEQLKGVSRVDSLEFILNKGDLVLDSQTKLRLMEKKNAHYLSLSAGMGVNDALPGIIEFIRELKSLGMQIALGSSSKNAHQILGQLELTDAFDAIVDGNRITLSKPDPEVFMLGARLMGLTPSECLVFEDAKAGVEAAINGGFQVVGVGNAIELSDANAIIDDFEKMNWERMQNLLSNS